MPTCEAKQYSDQMVCVRCRLTWDVNDPAAPQCDPITKIKIPTETMEQEFQTHYRRGYEAGYQAALAKGK